MDAGADKPEVQRFRKLVDAAEGTHNDTIEYSYCLVDLCFYLFAAQDLSNMEEYLDRAYVHKSVVEERRKKGITTLLIPPEETSVPPAKRQYDQWVEGGIDLLEVMHYASTHSMRSGDHAAKVKDAFLFCKDQYVDFGYSRDACMAEVDSILVDIWASDDPVLWKKKLIEIVATLMARGANDEPIAVGLVNYLKAVIIPGSSDRRNNGDKEAWIGMISPLVHEHVMGAEIPVALTSQIEEMLLKPIDQAEVEATIMRFPGLIGPDSHTQELKNWRPPFIMRGALMMTPVVRAPQPSAFPDLNYIPC